jgi:Kef-type K+ transport system membrane component KefB
MPLLEQAPFLIEVKQSFHRFCAYVFADTLKELIACTLSQQAVRLTDKPLPALSRRIDLAAHRHVGRAAPRRKDPIMFVTNTLSHLPSIAKFVVGMAIIVGIPPLFQRIRLPSVVGLLLTGVVVGPHVLRIYGQNAPTADFFAELGKLLLMFFAGTEIDLALFKRAKSKSITFGIITTSCPLILGTLVGFLFGYGAIAAIVIGSLLASHTLLGSPIVTRLGANHLEPVTITVGATVMSDTLSLVVFAICLSTFKSGFSAKGFILQILEIAAFIPLVLFGLSKAGGYFLKKVEKNESAYFVLMLVIVGLAGLLADLVNLPDIVGAFLAGLSINAITQGHPAKEKLEFFGNSLFIPSFFVVTGFLIDPMVFYHSLVSNFGLAVSIILALLVGKWIAVQVVGRRYHYTRNARMTMWSLTLPQVAATLAATLTAFKTFDPQGQRLLNAELLNVVLVLMLTTAILGPTLTEVFTPRLMKEEAAAPHEGNVNNIAKAS